MSSADPIDSAEASWNAVLERLRAATEGEFEIESELGQGGMAAVFLARDVALGRRVAIKVMSPALLLAPGMVRRFRDEAITVAKLSHPNIVTIHAVRQVGELHFFVMNYVEGRSLEGVLREVGALSVPVARAVLAQIGAALEFAHQHGVVHRDVKPANLLLDARGNCIVTDFGIAKMAESNGHTQTGQVIGTIAYMSPEQLEGGAVSGASDQYALGVVLYEMLAGRPPFGGSTLAMIQGHLRDAVPPIAPVRPDCPPELETALMRMLAKDPAERWPSIPEALVALEALPVPPGHVTRLQLAQLAGLRDVGPLPPRGTANRTMTIMGAPDTLPVGVTAPLTPKLEGVDATELQEPVRWVSDNAAVARVDQRGVITGVGEGIATISALAGPLQSTFRVRVVAGEVRAAPVAPAPPARRRRSVVPLALAATVAGGLLVGAGLYLTSGSGAPAADRTTRVVPPPASSALSDAATAPAATPAAESEPARPTAAAPAREEPARPAAERTPDPVNAAAAPSGAAPAADDAAAPAGSAEEQVMAGVNGFIAAFASGDEGRLRSVYPGLRGDEPWWQFAASHAKESLRVAYREVLAGYPQVEGDSAEVRFTVSLTYDGNSGAPRPTTFLARLTREADRWRIAEVRYF